jgi:hypothetical protein
MPSVRLPTPQLLRNVNQYLRVVHMKRVTHHKIKHAARKAVAEAKRRFTDCKVMPIQACPRLKPQHATSTRVQPKIQARTAQSEPSLNPGGNLFLTRKDTWFVIRFFFGRVGFPAPGSRHPSPIHGYRIIHWDRWFAQCILREALTASNRLGWARAAFETLANPPQGITQAALKAALATLGKLIRERDGLKVAYAAVVTIRTNWASTWGERLSNPSEYDR